MAFARLLFSILFPVFLATAALADGQRVILVLDASGSMWGQIGSKSKMDIAKQVVGKVIGSWKPEDELGLVAYGHRRKGACDDIETLIPPGPLDQGSYMSSVRGLSPKGKTPMTQAVRQAAEALKFTEKQATVILVSDGIETCDPNPCAVAEELEKLGVGLTVHTVGFGLDDKGAVEQLKCLAEKTGGISVIAENADELESALNKTVEAQPAPAPEPAAPAFNVTGHVVMAEGVELPAPWNQPVWTFTQAAADGGKGAYIRTEYGANFKASFDKPGAMIATVATDLAEVSIPADLAAGGTLALEANLNAGIVQFKGLMDAATPLSNDGAVWVISRADGTYVGTDYGKGPRKLLSAGDYKVKLEDGQASAEQAFSVAAGQTADLTVTLGAGVVNYTATYDGAQPAGDGVVVELLKPADISGNRQHISTEYGPAKQFRAAAGDYVLKASLGLAVTETPVKIEAGKAVTVPVSLNAGFMAVTAASATRIEIMSGEAGIDGSRKHLYTEYSGTLNIAGPPGSYRAVAFGDGDAVLGEKDFTVAVSQRSEVTVP
jgi:Ca-activated chloride channel family protein